MLLRESRKSLSAEQLAMSPADVFKANLHRLSEELGYKSHVDLAKALGYKLNDRRWIRRLWERGLDRPDHRRQAQLADLANLFGIKPKDLWTVQVSIKSTDVLHDADKWTELTRAVIETYLQFQIMKRNSRDDALEALHAYQSDEVRLIADYVASRYGIERPRLANRKLQSMDDCKKNRLEWRAMVNDIDSGGDALVNYIVEHAKDHQWFGPIVGELRDKYGEDAGEQFRQLLQRIRNRPRTPQEVLSELEAELLDALTDDHSFEVARREIENTLRHMWRAVVKKAPSIQPEVFAEYMITKLEEMEPAWS